VFFLKIAGANAGIGGGLWLVLVHHDRRETPLLIDLGDDREEAIPRALESWWAGRQ